MCLLGLALMSIIKDQTAWNPFAVVDVFLCIPLVLIPVKVYEKYQTLKVLYAHLQERIRKGSVTSTSSPDFDIQIV